MPQFRPPSAAAATAPTATGRRKAIRPRAPHRDLRPRNMTYLDDTCRLLNVERRPHAGPRRGPRRYWPHYLTGQAVGPEGAITMLPPPPVRDGSRPNRAGRSDSAPRSADVLRRAFNKCPHQESNLGCRGHDATS